MELGIEAARWMVGKALGPVSSGVLEAWAASTELGPNVEALRMELLYAEGMLNNARGRGRGGPDIQNPALSELLQKLRDLAYRADDVLDELDYFRIQDELDGTYHAAEEHDGGCFRNHALNARHTARAIARMLGFSKCSTCFATHAEPNEDTRSTGVPFLCGGHWPCNGVEASDDEEEEEDPSNLPNNQTNQLVVDNCCKGMGRITSAARSTIHTVGKHLPLPCYSTENAANSNGASTGRRLLCCARTNNKAPQREDVVQPQKLKFDRVDMSRKMKDIIVQLKPLCAKVSTILNLELLTANLNNNTGQHMAMGRPITTSEPIEPEFYGRMAVISKVVDGIKGEYHDVDLTVLPIVGPGGIGKTTLTQHIYNKELKDYFEVKLWECVSVNFNVSRLTQEIAKKLPTTEKRSPEEEIEEGLKSKRFLLVLDDIWKCNEDEWKRFLVPFKKGQTKGSVILVTTRFPALAQMVKTTDKIDLEGIEKEAFKELFFIYVFGNKKPPEGHSELLDIGEKIIEKLKGSPLAAKTVGRLLRNHLDSGHWTRVLESREWESQSGDHDIMPALKLSFDYLPFHLQQCFVYCSLFPEDYKFSEEEIIYFWIGLDVLHSRGENKKIEDIGQCYLIELLDHGFFKKEEDENGHTYYVIHDLMHELGLKVSADECLSLYSSNVRSIQILPSVRHLSINIDDSSVKDRKAFDICKEDFSVLGERLRVEKLHSLMLFGKHQGSFVKTFHGLFSKAKSLRVIMISGEFYTMEDLFHNFSELIHLRYLRVHSNYWSNNKLIASNSISRFYHMRVLDLQGCQDYDTLARYITNLVKLRHFVVEDGTIHSGILEVGKLKSLQELKIFEVGKESKGFELSQIGHLPELRGSLRIDNLENVEGREAADEAKLMHKRNLNELILNWSPTRSNKDSAHEEQVLEGLKPPSNLKKLSIRGHGGDTCPSWLGLNMSVQNLESIRLDGLNWETFPPIGELQLVNSGTEEKLSNSPSKLLTNLERIELANLERLERWVVCSSGQLLFHLKVLEITSCPELLELPFSDCNYNQQDHKTWPPNLRRLVIQGCPKLLSLLPVPWTHSPCFISISEVGLGFKSLTYEKFLGSSLSLKIIGNDSQDIASFWTSLDFNNLTTVKRLRVITCPPLPLDGVQKLSSLRDLEIIDCNNVFGPVEDGRHADYQFAVERMEIRRLGASGKELTRVLSYMSKLSELRIDDCERITGLGVVEQQEEEATVCSSSRSREVDEIEAAEEGLLLLPPKLLELKIFNPSVILTKGLPRILDAVSSSSSFPLPSSLQSLTLFDVEISKCVSLGRVLPHCCLQELSVFRTTNFFSIGPDSIPSSSIKLSSLWTDDVAGVLAAPICKLLSSSLTKLIFTNMATERLTVEQDEALQLLTSLQHLQFDHSGKLQSLPAGLHRLPNLRTLEVEECPSIRLLPTKDGLPISLQNLTIAFCSAFRTLHEDGLPESLQQLCISNCPIRALPKASLPSSLQNLRIIQCSALRTLPKDGLPNSLKELEIVQCPSIQALPKAGLPTSLKLIDVRWGGNSDELKRQCRNLIGTIPIVKLD